jgi:hypothetical protein
MINDTKNRIRPPFRKAVEIFGGGEERHTLFRILSALVQSASVSFVRQPDHLTSAD